MQRYKTCSINNSCHLFAETSETHRSPYHRQTIEMETNTTRYLLDKAQFTWSCWSRFDTKSFISGVAVESAASIAVSTPSSLTMPSSSRACHNTQRALHMKYFRTATTAKARWYLHPDVGGIWKQNACQSVRLTALGAAQTSPSFVSRGRCHRRRE